MVVLLTAYQITSSYYTTRMVQFKDSVTVWKVQDSVTGRNKKFYLFSNFRPASGPILSPTTYFSLAFKSPNMTHSELYYLMC